MSEKIYTANSRKENFIIKNPNIQYQNHYQDEYDEYGQLSRKVSNSAKTYKQKIGEGKVDGLSWTWITQLDNATMTTSSEEVISSYIRFKWSKLEGVLGFTGGIDFKLNVGDRIVANKHVDALVEFSGQWIGVRNLQSVSKVLPDVPDQQHRNQMGWNQGNGQNKCCVEFSFALTPVFVFTPATNIISNFEKTHITDAILEVQGKQLHVNKSFLSIHSEFFEKMFNSNFKEKSQATIQIQDVEFQDFSNFLSLVYPNQAEITVEKVSKYLELADKYLMATVTRRCEEFLLQNKRIKTIQKIVFADLHNLNKLLRVTLSSVESREELEALTLLPEFSQFSDSTKTALLHKFMHFIN